MSSSTTDTYRKVGRGGAGNYYNPADVETDKPRVDDIEAQVEAADYVAQINPNRPAPRELATMGRGGAGNWYQPSDIFQTPPLSTVPAEGNVKAYSGRGGAGNYQTAVIESEVSRKQREAEEQRLRDQVERDVEMGLKSPEKAYVGDGRVAHDRKRA